MPALRIFLQYALLLTSSYSYRKLQSEDSGEGDVLDGLRRRFSYALGEIMASRVFAAAVLLFSFLCTDVRAQTTVPPAPASDPASAAPPPSAAPTARSAIALPAIRISA